MILKFSIAAYVHKYLIIYFFLYNSSRYENAKPKKIKTLSNMDVGTASGHSCHLILIQLFSQ